MSLEPLRRVLEVRKVLREDQSVTPQHKRPNQQAKKGDKKKGKVDLRV
jgi:hypothetical protein